MSNWNKQLTLHVGLTTAFLVLLSTAAHAAIGNTRYSRGSIDCASVVSGLGNVIDDSDAYGCEVDITEITLRCVNNGGQSSNPQNHVFNRGTAILGSASFGTTFFPAATKGKADATASITDQDISDAIGELDIECQNPNWTPDLTTVVVTGFDSTVYQFDCSQFDGDATLLDLPGLIFECRTKDTDSFECSGTPDIGEDYSCTEM